MKYIIALAAVFSLQSFADANAPTAVHVWASNLTCEGVQQAVWDHGAVILHYGDGLYDRAVSNSGWCPMGTWADNLWVPTTDDRTCFAGYVCNPRGGDGGPN